MYRSVVATWYLLFVGSTRSAAGYCSMRQLVKALQKYLFSDFAMLTNEYEQIFTHILRISPMTERRRHVVPRLPLLRRARRFGNDTGLRVG